MVLRLLKNTVCIYLAVSSLMPPYGKADLSLLSLTDPSIPSHWFWSCCFGFQSSDTDLWVWNIMAASNQNLSLAQKELLLWHQHLSHAGLSTVQSLVCHRRASKVDTVSDLVHLRDGPYLPCTYNMPKAPVMVFFAWPVRHQRPLTALLLSMKNLVPLLVKWCSKRGMLSRATALAVTTISLLSLVGTSL
jgi:hypothetical protein